MTYEVSVNGTKHKIELQPCAGNVNRWSCKLDGREIEFDAIPLQDGAISLLVGGVSYEVRRDFKAAEMLIFFRGKSFQCEVRDPRSLRARRQAGDAAEGVRKIIAPMPGKVVRVIAQAGTAVEAGQGVVVIEAMKMQNELKSPKKGMVQRVLAGEGAAVNAGDTLAIVD